MGSRRQRGRVRRDLRRDSRRDPRRDSRRDPRRDAPRDPRRDSPRREPAPAAAPPPRGAPRVGDWLLTTREGAEGDLVDELDLALGPGAARVVAPALVRARAVPTFADGGIDLTFARQGFPVAGEAQGDSAAALGATGAALVAAAAGPGGAWTFQAFTPDSAAGNARTAQVDAVAAATVAALETLAPATAARRVSDELLHRLDGRLVQLCLTAADRALVGAIPIGEAVSPWPGGRARMRVAGDRPSRAARKLEEALAWLGVAPLRGEVCADLGAAPGGWSWVLLARGARVVAVDPARLRPDLAARRGLTHVAMSAFQFEPEEPCDWLFCDMAWRPLEVAALLAKWGRRRWARMLVANVKLPMRQKAAMAERVRAVVAGGGWRGVRTRQLYHDRDELTLVAHRA